MKKKEVLVIGIILLVAIGALLFLNKRNGLDDGSLGEAKGEWIGVIHHNKVVLYFDSGIDDTYTVKGDIGEMVIEVKDQSWRVLEVECPNHVCEQMGWHNTDTIGIPITCVPNDIVIAEKKTIDNMEIQP